MPGSQHDGSLSREAQRCNTRTGVVSWPVLPSTVIAESYQTPSIPSGHTRAFRGSRYHTSSFFRPGSSERSNVNSICSSANVLPARVSSCRERPVVSAAMDTRSVLSVKDLRLSASYWLKKSSILASLAKDDCVTFLPANLVMRRTVRHFPPWITDAM